MMFKRLWLGLFLLHGIICQAGTIVVSTNTLFNFGNCPISYVSDPQKYTVSGTALGGPIEIVAPEHFEISLTYNTRYGSKIVLNATAGVVTSTTIYVRFSPYTSGAKTGNLNHSSPGSASQSKATAGTATANPMTGTNASTYYNTIGSVTAASLKTALYNKILGHSATSYSGLWATYTNTDKTYNGKVWDIYSTRLDVNSPFEFTFSSDQCGNYTVEGDCYNREHSFPQSWFNQASPMVSDMFHIYPTDGKVNGMRSNFPFGEVSTPTYTSMQGAKLGNNTTSGYTGTVFEPINDYKGDLARSFFYMATRYQNLIVSWNSLGNANDVLDGNTFPGYDAWYMQMLIKWHNQDPPTAKEIERNNVIYGYQGNRNPFIDSPQYVNRIWGGASATEPTIAGSQFVLKSNTSTNAIIGWESGNGQRRLVIARAGAPVNWLPSDLTDYTPNTIFGQAVQQGSGNFVVYNGMGSTAQISGLLSNTTYHFLVVEANGYGGASNYLSSAALASGSISVPVEWLNLNAQLNEDQTVLLQWQTAQEINNAYFEIERDNGHGFENIGRLKGKINSSVISTYQFLDPNPSIERKINTGISYRIKQVDTDGRYSYSPVAKIEIDPIAEISVSNPIEDGLLLRSTIENEPVTIRLSNLLGEIVFETKTSINYETFISLDLPISSGMYVLTIVQRSGQQSHKIIKP